MNYRFLFLMIAAIALSACSRKPEEQLFTEAKQAVDKPDYALAVNLYSELVANYPTGVHAEEAQYNIALIYNNDLHDANKAIAAYRAFREKFPNSAHAPSALFLCGFLYNNELHNIDSAKATYETFLKMYPTNELAQSAQFELSTLGKDPDTVLHQDILAKEVQDEPVNGDDTKPVPPQGKKPKGSSK